MARGMRAAPPAPRRDGTAFLRRRRRAPRSPSFRRPSLGARTHRGQPLEYGHDSLGHLTAPLLVPLGQDDCSWIPGYHVPVLTEAEFRFIVFAGDDVSLAAVRPLAAVRLSLPLVRGRRRSDSTCRARCPVRRCPRHLRRRILHPRAGVPEVVRSPGGALP